MMTCGDPTQQHQQVDDNKKKKLDFEKLLISIVIDVIGSASGLVTLLGEVSDFVWAPIAALILRSLYASNVVFALEFLEEILPFTDILPFATTW